MMEKFFGKFGNKLVISFFLFLVVDENASVGLDQSMVFVFLR